jgi:type IV pilus assembly protein PilP
MKRIAVVFPLVLALIGCSNSNDDLQAWMQEQGNALRGKIEPIPELQPYEAFVFNPGAVVDPFKPRKVDIGRANTTQGPDQNRRREALEAFPLEKIRMVGTVQQSRDLAALVRTEDNRVFQVRKGNYVGQNFGVVTSVSESEIALRELFQDGAGEWVEKLSRIGLSESKAGGADGSKQ